MQPRDYAAALCRRWVWVAAAGVVGAVLAVALSVTSPVTYTASSSVFVGVDRAESSEGLAYSALVAEDVVPSVVQLATSTAVLGPVAGELRPATTAGELAASLDVVFTRENSLLHIAASAPTAERAAQVANAVAEQLTAVTDELYSGTEGRPALRLTSVGPAEEPLFQSSPATRRNALLGLVGGLAVGALAVGTARLVRPLVHNADDVVAVLGAPALTTVPAGRPGRRSRDGRTAGLERLRWLLGSTGPVDGTGRLILLGTTRRGAGHLARELAPEHDGAGPEVVHVRRADLLATAGPRAQDAVVVVADSGRTSHRSLREALAAVDSLPAPLAGVVLDRVADMRSGRITRLLASLRGEARWGAARPGGRTGGEEPPNVSGPVVAVAALFLLGLAYPLQPPVTTGLIAALALLPVWAGALPRFRGAAFVCVLTAVGLVSGVLLARRMGSDHGLSTYLAAETVAMIITGVGIVGVVLWARTMLPLSWIGVAYGAGRLVTGLMRAPGSENAVKFELALPLAIVLLALVSGRKHVAAALAALAALGLLNITNDSRSAFGFCVVAAGLVLWQRRPASMGQRSSRALGAVVLAGVAVGGYFALSELLLAGALGSEVQARTATQIAQSGSLLLGGRPEWTATWALMQHTPWGFGIGTVPSAHDVMVAKSGMALAHVPTAETYLEYYMMGDRVELHSVVADLWAHLGPAGLLLGLTLAVLLVHGLLDRISRRDASALVCFLVPISVWFLAFGPLPSNLPEIAFTVGLVLADRRGTGRADADGATPGAEPRPLAVPARS